MKLYEITQALAKIDEMSEQDSSLVEYLDGIQLQLNEKVNNIVKFERSLEMSAKAIDLEIERLTKLKESMEGKAKRLKDYVAYSMQKNGIEKIETDIARLSFRKSESLIIEDMDRLPKEFVTLETKLSPDKVAIKKAIHDGREIEGAHIEEKQHLQIK